MGRERPDGGRRLLAGPGAPNAGLPQASPRPPKEETVPPNPANPRTERLNSERCCAAGPGAPPLLAALQHRAHREGAGLLAGLALQVPLGALAAG